MSEVRDKDGLTEEEFLAAYHQEDYPRPSVAADMVIFTVTDEEEENYRKLPKKELRVLLIQRGGRSRRQGASCRRRRGWMNLIWNSSIRSAGRDVTRGRG